MDQFMQAAIEEAGKGLDEGGIPIGSVTPEEIAVSIMAQVIQHRREHAPTGLGDRSCGGVVAQDGKHEATASPRP